MRSLFAEYLYELKKLNPKIILLSGDIGNKLFDKYKKKYPKFFYNCGIAEANMTTVAAGLAKSGFIPISYTIATFNTLKTIEQIKIDICYPKLPVIIIGTGSGISYSSLGTTHHSVEDIGILRTLPNIDIYSPCDNDDLKSCLKKALRNRRPAYIRISKKESWRIKEYKNLNKKKYVYSLREKLKSDILIITSGIISKNVFDSMVFFKNTRLNPSILPISKIKDLDKNIMSYIFKKFKKIVVVEEHIRTGGLCSAVIEFAVTNNLDFNTKNIKSLSLPNKFLKGLGSKSEALKTLKLDARSLYENIKKFSE